MKRTAIATLTVLTLLGFACSRAEHDAPPNSTIDAPLVLSASEATRSELGVSTWGVSAGHGDATVVRGYDAADTKTIELELQTSEGYRRSFEAKLSRKGAAPATLKLDIGADRSQARVVENTFAKNVDANRIVDRIVADLDSQPARMGGAGGGTLLSSGVGPSAVGLLTDASACLTRTCGESLRGSATAGATTTAACQSSTTDCNTGNTSASDAQQQASKDCSCGKVTDGSRKFLAPFPCGQTWTYTHYNGEIRQALDFVNPSGSTDGSSVLASADGTATQHVEPNGAGNYISIDHGDSWKTYYFHLQSFSVGSGVEVKQGQEIGKVGSTGRSSGPHLHYEQLRDGQGQPIELEGKSLSPYPASYGEATLTSSNCGQK
ncbi:M23 family metallopeptidase [Pendulispora albinea]|uniref:M23 family metallopeptidase n=1 Tax=Pendulispora albinea TaxID=2741071 RepID=A0ABZ2LQM4_9BACT